MATQISATYVNKSRLNLTRCVIVLGHDSARYTGTQRPRVATASLDPQRPQHAAERRELPAPLGPVAGDHDVQAERPARPS